MAKSEPEKRRFACGIVVKQLPSVDQILAQFDVDIEQGTFRHKKLPDTAENKLWNKNWGGHDATCGAPANYLSVKVGKFRYQAHRLIWKVATGRDPHGVIDHINGVRDDNRLVNLRDVTPHENMMNAVNGRWAAEVARRSQLAHAERDARIENRERELLARLKAKYEPSGEAERG